MADGAHQSDYELKPPAIRAPSGGGFDELDPREILAFLRRRFNVIAGCVILITSIAALVTFQLTPIYSATAAVKIDTRQRNVAPIDPIYGQLNLTSDVVDTEVEVIRSRALLRRVVKETALTQDREFNPSLREKKIPDQFNPIALIKAIVGGREDVRELTEDEELEWAIVTAIDSLRERIRVGRRDLTYVINIEMKSEDPQKAASIANAVANAYILDQLEAKFEATHQANTWLAEQLSDLRDSVRISENAVEIFRSENDLRETEGATLAEQQLSDLNAQLALSRADKAEKTARLRRTEQLLRNGGGVDAVAEVINSETISDLRQQQALVVRKRAEFASRYGDRHPEMIKVRRELNDLETQIAAEVNRIVSALRNDVGAEGERERSLMRSIASLTENAAENDRARVKLRELERDAEANRLLYEAFLNRQKETSQQEDLLEPDARLISQATAPIAPSEPNTKLNIAGAFAFSTVLGVAFALLLERLDNGFRTSAQVEQTLNLIHLASVPRLDRTSSKVGGRVLSPPEYVLSKPLSSFSESFRFMRTAVTLSDVDRRPKTILFTSALPNEGKTTTAVCFARSAASSDLKVVLVDADLRRPSVHKVLGMEPERGLVEYLAGQSELEDVVIKDKESGADVIPIVPNAATPPDLLGSEALKTLLRRLSGEYDLVILDSAPVLPVAATKALAQVADKTVFIARWQDTPRDAAKAAVKELRALRVDIAGAVLSQIDLKKQSSYAYGDSSYYHGQYSRYYNE